MLASPPYFGGSPCSIARMSFQSLYAITMQGCQQWDTLHDIWKQHRFAGAGPSKQGPLSLFGASV